MSRLSGEEAAELAVNRYPRSAGSIFLAIGLALAKWQIYDPLHEAKRAGRGDMASSVIIGTAVILTLFGTALVVFGRRPIDWITIDPKSVGWKKALLLVGVVILCGAVLEYVEHHTAPVSAK